MENPQLSIGNLIIYKRAMFHSYVSFLEGIMVIFFGTYHQQDWTWDIGRNGIWLSRWVWGYNRIYVITMETHGIMKSDPQKLAGKCKAQWSSGHVSG